MTERRLGIAYAAVTVLIFAGWFVVTRFAVTHALGPADLAVIRFGVGLLVLSPALLRALPPGAWREGLVFSLLWGFPFVLLLGFGVARTSAADASSVTPTLTPLFAGLIAWAIGGAAPGPGRVLGYAAIVGGVALLLLAHLHGGVPLDGLGLLTLVASSLIWSVYTVLFRRSALPATAAAALICFWSTVLFLPVYLLLGIERLHAASWGEIGLQVGYQGVLMSAVGIVTFNRAVVLLGPGASSAVIAMVPVAAAALAALFLGEVPPPLALLAVPLIAGGVVLAARAPARLAGPE